MNPEYQLILSSTLLHSSTKELEVINNLIPKIEDWEALTKLIIGNTCAPLVYKKVNKLPNSYLIPKESLALLRKAYYTTVSRSSLMYTEFSKVVELFQHNNINFVALKGIYLCEWLYKDIGLRQFSDIDLLVDKEDASKAMNLLLKMGYSQYQSEVGLGDFVDSISNQKDSNFTHYEALTKNNISIEIHLKLSPDKYKEKYNLDITELFNKSVTSTINSQQIRVLHPYDLLIHIAIHTDLHFRHSHIQFTCFNDLVNLLELFKTEFNWDEFITRCKQFNCEKAVFTHLILVNKYYNAYLPPFIIDKYAYLQSDLVEEKFMSFLKGEVCKMIESKSYIGGHLQNLKSIRSVRVFMRYMVEVLFPGKEFMVEKYRLVYSKQYIVNSEEKTSLFYKLNTINYKLIFWWLWYGYRWWMGLKGFWYVVRGTSTSSVASTEKRKEK